MGFGGRVQKCPVLQAPGGQAEPEATPCMTNLAGVSMLLITGMMMLLITSSLYSFSEFSLINSQHASVLKTFFEYFIKFKWPTIMLLVLKKPMICLYSN